MASSPRWKVYSPDGEYLASFKYPEHAAGLLTLRGDGTTLRYGHSHVVWEHYANTTPSPVYSRRGARRTEFILGDAGQSYDEVAIEAAAYLDSLANQ